MKGLLDRRHREARIRLSVQGSVIGNLNTGAMRRILLDRRNRSSGDLHSFLDKING